jgi:hypothetical protein
VSQFAVKAGDGYVAAQRVAIGIIYPVTGRTDELAQWKLTDLGRECVAALGVRSLNQRES